MIHINLLPVRAAQKKEKLRSQIAVTILALILTIVACASVYASLLFKVDELKDEIASKEARIGQLKKVLGEVAAFKKKKEELVGKLDILSQLKDGKSGPVHLLDELSLVLPEKLWLSSFKESGGSVAISGVGLNEDMVALFLKNLEKSPYYKNVELQVIEQSTQAGVKTNKFNVVAKVEAPPKAASK
ncbi:PilN domain-containing protein [Trichloromonas sp.]|uniref:PilN domain-containing protein n=1 Tax=Trichloromonas sp. TaxID=3069249 RepID=UPI003D81389C